MVFLGLIRRYWLPETIVKIQAQSLSYFLLRKRNFHIRKLLKTLNSIFSKKRKEKKRITHRLDFFPKPLDYVPLNFPIKNQSLIEAKIIYCWQWKRPLKNRKHTSKYLKGRNICWQKVSRFLRLLVLSAKVYVRELYQNMLTSKVYACILSKNEPSAKVYIWKHQKMSRLDRTAKLSVPQSILYCTTTFYEILILHLKKNGLFI